MWIDDVKNYLFPLLTKSDMEFLRRELLMPSGAPGRKLIRGATTFPPGYGNTAKEPCQQACLLACVGLNNGAVTAEEVEHHFVQLFNEIERIIKNEGGTGYIADRIIEEWDNHCNQDENEKALLEALEECLKG